MLFSKYTTEQIAQLEKAVDYYFQVNGSISIKDIANKFNVSYALFSKRITHRLNKKNDKLQ